MYERGSVFPYVHDVILLKSKDGKYPSVFWTIYKHEVNDKRALVNYGQLK